jgi:hypothetical protein
MALKIRHKKGFLSLGCFHNPQRCHEIDPPEHREFFHSSPVLIISSTIKSGGVEGDAINKSMGYIEPMTHDQQDSTGGIIVKSNSGCLLPIPAEQQVWG